MESEVLLFLPQMVSVLFCCCCCCFFFTISTADVLLRSTQPRPWPDSWSACWKSVVTGKGGPEGSLGTIAPKHAHFQMSIVKPWWKRTLTYSLIQAMMYWASLQGPKLDAGESREVFSFWAEHTQWTLTESSGLRIASLVFQSKPPLLIWTGVIAWASVPHQ